jgi:hypothetical protein
MQLHDMQQLHDIVQAEVIMAGTSWPAHHGRHIMAGTSWPAHHGRHIMAGTARNSPWR